MPRVTRSSLTVVGVCALILSAAGVGMCQGLVSYNFIHPFGLTTATTARQFGMGGPVSCVADRGSGNPAFAALNELPGAGLSLATTRFDNGTKLIGEQASVVYPLGDQTNGFQLTLFNLYSNSGNMMVLGPGGVPMSVDLKLSEDDIGLHYGRRLTPRWSAGIGITPHSKLRFTATVPGGPTVEDINASPDYGARLGTAYQYAPGDYAGVVFDYYQESVEANGLAFGGPASGVFHNQFLAVGASRHFRPNLLGVVEYQNARSVNGDTHASLSGWHFGAEYQPTHEYAVRAGLNDMRLALGAGFQNSRWQVDYAYMNRWNDDIAADLFGSSDTHQLQVIYRW